MKGLKLILAAAMMVASTGAFAQFANSSSSSSNSGGGFLKNGVENYNRFSIGYSTMKHSISAADSDYDSYCESYNDDAETYKGLQLGYLAGINITGKNIPLHLEVGGTLLYHQYSDDYDSYDDSYTITDRRLSVAVPVNLAFKMQFDNGIFIQPYMGMKFKFNVLASISSTESHTSAIDCFNKKDVGSDNTLNRFQFGGEFGLRAGWKFIDLNIGYYLDSPLKTTGKKSEKMSLKTKGLFVGVGFNF